MNDIVLSLVGKTISLVCFGQFVGFIHFDEGGYCRFEVEARLSGSDGIDRPLFPEPLNGSIGQVLGKTVRAASVSNGTLSMNFDDCVLHAALLAGYESVIVRVGDNFGVLMT